MKLFKNLSEACKQQNTVQALKISIKEEEFPSTLMDFSNLEELYLEGSCKRFPKVAPIWNKLKVLSIKWSEFTGDLSSLFSLPALENLKIIETPMKGFLLPLGHVPAPLKSLTVKECGLEKLPEEIAMLEQLTELNLSGNKLSSLPASLASLKNLKRLNLDNNEFTKFPELIKTIPSLNHLSIDGNKFSTEEKTRIQQVFKLWVN